MAKRSRKRQDKRQKPGSYGLKLKGWRDGTLPIFQFVESKPVNDPPAPAPKARVRKPAPAPAPTTLATTTPQRVIATVSAEFIERGYFFLQTEGLSIYLSLAVLQQLYTGPIRRGYVLDCEIVPHTDKNKAWPVTRVHSVTSLSGAVCSPSSGDQVLDPL